jgi:hypothetical protein
MCDPEVEIVNWAESPIRGPYYGRDGVRQWWDDVAEAFEGVRLEVMSIEPIDDERARDGRITKAVGYISPSEARRAAGVG